jgi:tetratricopeptide (TPR) repeat protein
VDIRVDDAADPFVELRRLLQIAQRVPVQHTERAAQLAAEGKFAEAIAEQKRALAIQPHSDTLHYAMAQRYAQAGEREQALASLREAVRLHPNLRKQAAADPMFAKIRDEAGFQRLVAAR